MKSSCNVASRLNDILLTYKDFIDNYEELMFDSDWIEAFENLDDLSSEIRKIPVQYGNDGSISTTTELPNTPMPVPAPVQQQPVQVQQPYPQNNIPVQQQTPQIPKTSRGLSFSALAEVVEKFAAAELKLAAAYPGCAIENPIRIIS